MCPHCLHIERDDNSFNSAQYLTLQQFSNFTNLKYLHIILIGFFQDNNEFAPLDVKLSLGLTGVIL